MKDIVVNRAPFLTLWAAVVAQRLGYSEDEALTLGKAVAGQTAAAKGKRLGLVHERPRDEKEKISERREAMGATRVSLMGRTIPCMVTEEGLRALSGTSMVDPDSVRRYLRGKFKDRLSEVQEKLSALAALYEEDDLQSQAMDLYMRLRPVVASGTAGWGRAGTLDLARIDQVIDRKRHAASGA